MLIAYHNYQLDNEAFIDGSNYYYLENTRLLQEQKPRSIKLVPHDFKSLVQGKEKLPKLTKKDALLSNVGPYAHIYHYLREKHNLKFRIIRDVQTGLWPGYFFQEKICNKYMREGDKVMFLSEFARQLHIKLFPETLNEDNTFVCAPLMHFFPKEIKKREKDDNLILGWVGRVTNSKNFDQALDAFIKLNKERDNVKFIVAGEPFVAKTKLSIKKTLEKNRVKQEDFIYINGGNFIPYNSVWDVYGKMDVFLFPSLAIPESLGRTIIEACYAGVPVIASYHGAAPELLNEKNLVSVEYRNDLFQLNPANPYTFGKVGMEDFMKKLHNYKNLSRMNNTSKYSNHYIKFFNILQNIEPKEKLVGLNKQVKNFINEVQLYNDKPNFNIKKVIKKTTRFITGKTDIMKPNNKICNKENYYILRLYASFLPAFLNYVPYASLTKKDFKISLQKFIMDLKKPIRKPFQIASYFDSKHRYITSPAVMPAGIR